MASIDFHRAFGDPMDCESHFLTARWPTADVQCARCGGGNPYFTRDNYFKCKKCGYKFNEKSGTVLAGSKIDMAQWYYLIYSVARSRGRLSSVQLAKDVNLTQKTVYYAINNIRYVIGTSNYMLNGVVEIDEAFIGSKWVCRRKKPGKTQKMVLGMKERGGRLLLFHIPNRNIATLQKLIESHVSPEATVVTDGWRAYPKAVGARKHVSINHTNQEWVIDGGWHTNTIEAVWGRFKKGIRYAHHSISAKHLQAYCDEFAFRENTAHMDDMERFNKLIDIVATTNWPR